MEFDIFLLFGFFTLTCTHWGKNTNVEISGSVLLAVYFSNAANNTKEGTEGQKLKKIEINCDMVF